MDRLLRRDEVQRIAGIRTTALYAAMNQGRFPRSVVVGPRCVRWRESEVRAWLESLPETTGDGIRRSS